MKPVRIKLKDLFNALPDKCKYITKEEFANYHQAWKFKPVFVAEYSFDKRPTWIGSIHTKKELGYWTMFCTEEELKELETETEEERAYHLAGNGFAQSIWEVEEFVNKPISQCIAFREDYKDE